MTETPSIICCGEAIIDMLPRQLPGGDEAYLPVPGGAVFNTALALGRLGEPAGFFGGISSDMFGQKLVKHLSDSGVNSAYCIRSDKPTTLAFVKLQHGQANYLFVDENTAGRMIDTSLLPTLPDSVKALHFGAISLIPEPCGSAFQEFMKCNHKSKVISLDPNIRPGFIQGETIYRERIEQMIAMSDIIKVSDEDLYWLQPGSQFESKARQWISAGASVVILTEGKKGARAITKDLDVYVSAKKVKVVDTVGAGDTFNAGFLSGLCEHDCLSKIGLQELSSDQLRACLSFASEVAAYTVGQSGANPPWRDRLKS